MLDFFEKHPGPICTFILRFLPGDLFTNAMHMVSGVERLLSLAEAAVVKEAALPNKKERRAPKGVAPIVQGGLGGSRRRSIVKGAPVLRQVLCFLMCCSDWCAEVCKSQACSSYSSVTSVFPSVQKGRWNPFLVQQKVRETLLVPVL